MIKCNNKVPGTEECEFREGFRKCNKRNVDIWVRMRRAIIINCKCMSKSPGGKFHEQINSFVFLEP
jgi:hypothetical protein